MASAASLVADINKLVGPDCRDPGEMIEFQRSARDSMLAYFTASDPLHGRELWCTDGTPAGTRLVADIETGTIGSDPAELTVAGSHLFFVATRGGQRELWKTDGTPAGTVPVKNIWTDYSGGMGGPEDRSSNPHGLTASVAGKLFFAASDNRGTELWTSDGTEAGTVIVADLSQALPIGGPRSSDPADIVAWKSGVLFTATDGSSPRKMWMTDGSKDGTFPVQPYITNPSHLVVGAGGVFCAGESEGQLGVWKTSPGFFELPESEPIAAFDGLGEIVPFGEGVIAAVSRGGNSGIWYSDGQYLGDETYVPIDPLGSTFASDLTVSGNSVFFTADDKRRGRELWVTDGTLAGTDIAADIHQGPAASGPRRLTPFKDGVALVADNGLDGRELWYADRTTRAPVMLADTNPNGDGIDDFSSASFAAVARYGDKLYFGADGGDGEGRRLWTSDGTLSGTNVLRGTLDAFEPMFSSAAYAASAVVGGVMYFAADDGVTGKELWKSDGTAVGTVRVADLTPGAQGSSIAEMATVGNVVVFAANGKLWSTRGTSATTVALADGRFAGFTKVGSVLFAERDGCELWRTDGTTIGTRLVESTQVFPGIGRTATAVVGDSIYYVKYRTSLTQSGYTLRRATPEGGITTVVPVGTFEFFGNLLTVRGGLLFEASSWNDKDGTWDWALWTTGGGGDGYARFDAIDSYDLGSVGSSSEGIAYVNVRDATKGESSLATRTLWRTDGTTAGTRKVSTVQTATDQLGGYYGGMWSTGGKMFRLWRTDTEWNVGQLRVVGGADAAVISICDGVEEIVGTIGNKVVFRVRDNSFGVHLAITDGTIAGTSILPDAPKDTQTAGRVFSESLGTTGFMQAFATSTGMELYRFPLAVTGALVPGQTRNLRVSAGDGSVRLAWRAPASDGGDAINAYRIEYSTDGGASWTSRLHSATEGTRATVAGLTNGASYRFRISAKDSPH